MPWLRLIPLLCSLWGWLPLANAGVANATTGQQPGAQPLIRGYIEAWKAFYPSAAFAYGDAGSAHKFENYDPGVVAAWLNLNQQTAVDVRAGLALDGLSAGTRTDLQVLLGQAENELANWEEDQPLRQQPQWYAEQVSQALTNLLVREQRSDDVRSAALVARLEGVRQLCATGVQYLSGGNALRTQSALTTLAATREFYRGNLRALTADWPAAETGGSIGQGIDEALTAINRLEAHLRAEILPQASTSAGIGSRVYTAKLARRTSGLYTPDRLRDAAAAEIIEVRTWMRREAELWRSGSQSTAGQSAAGGSVLSAAIEAMESDRQSNSRDFLASFIELTGAAEAYVEREKIATVLKPTTLAIALSPAHFSGAAVGGVYPAGPFATEADTLFYVPSIPDTADAGDREGFYRSFNNHFNTMIISHEMFPGHYLQYKVAINQAPAVRSLFANGSYVEGWGSFSERLMLDAGWADHAPLARLAHLRKRLENATRAYVSVQVNTADWGEAEVQVFAREEGLLAPQFARNLWQRVVNTPLQITDYFTGYRHFERLYTRYRNGPDARDTRTWVDAVLRAGPVPPGLLEALL